MIRTKNEHDELEFQLGRKIEDFPVRRVIRITRKQYLHFVYIQDPDNVDESLLDWLKEWIGLISN